jgi:hypothetical protein
MSFTSWKTLNIHGPVLIEYILKAAMFTLTLQERFS